MIYLDGIIFRLQKYGGITVYFKQVIRAVADISDEWCILLQDNEQGYCADNVIVEPSRLISSLRAVVLPKNSHIIFHSSYWRLPRSEAKVIVTVHDLIAENSFVSLKSKLHLFFRKRALQRANVIIAISESTKKDLLVCYPTISTKKVIVVYNSVSDCYLSSEIRLFRDPKSFVFVGSRGGYKNFNKAVQALSCVPGARLTIVGGNKLSRSEKKILKGSLNSNFVYFPFLTDLDLRSVYETSNALLYPSGYEGFGLPVAEALACGCFVICGSNSSLAEVHGGLNFDIGSGSIEEIEAAVLASIEASVDFERRVVGSARISSLFSFTIFKNAMRKIYFD